MLIIYDYFKYNGGRILNNINLTMTPIENCSGISNNRKRFFVAFKVIRYFKEQDQRRETRYELLVRSRSELTFTFFLENRYFRDATFSYRLRNIIAFLCKKRELSCGPMNCKERFNDC